MSAGITQEKIQLGSFPRGNLPSKSIILGEYIFLFLRLRIENSKSTTTAIAAFMTKETTKAVVSEFCSRLPGLSVGLVVVEFGRVVGGMGVVVMLSKSSIAVECRRSC